MNEILAVIAGGSYGAVAGGFLAGALAAALGAPVGTGPSELVPGFGWNRFTAFLIGLPIGFAAGAIVVVRASRRWPWLVGLPAAILGVLVLVSLLADSTQWDSSLVLLVLVLPGVAFVMWYLRGLRRR